MILATLQIERQAREVLMQAPKNGFFYVLDRATGELISAETFVEVTWADGIDLETGRPRIRESALYGDAPAVVAPTAIGGHNWQPMAFNPGTEEVGASTGEAVWDISTGLGIIAPPVTYELDGVQYVTVSAGWGGNSGRYFSPAGDAAQYEQIGRVMTFALDANAPMPTPQLRATEPYVAQLELSTDAASTERGESLFAVNCSLRHGDGGNSLGTMPNLLRMTQQTHEAFQSIVFDGAREPLGMPSFQTVLERDDVGLIHAYLVQQARQATGGG